MQNVKAGARIPHLYELNIGHSIVARALFGGMRRAVREMQEVIMQEVIMQEVIMQEVIMKDQL